MSRFLENSVCTNLHVDSLNDLPCRRKTNQWSHLDSNAGKSRLFGRCQTYSEQHRKSRTSVTLQNGFRSTLVVIFMFFLHEIQNRTVFNYKFRQHRTTDSHVECGHEWSGPTHSNNLETIRAP